jgi:uncharacterized membrane protein
MTGLLRIVSALAVFSVCMLFCLASCTSGDEKDDHRADVDEVNSASDLEVVRGHYVFGHEVRSLRPCGEDDTLWVVDRTNLLKNLHGELTSGTRPYPEIFVVAVGRVGPPQEEGFGADYSSTLTVEDVIYAASEGFGCNFDLSRFIYRALGTEPFWMVEVRQNEMSLTRPGHPTLMWAEVNPKQVGGRVVFQAGGDDRPTVKLVIEKGPRRDTMSGAYFGLSATLVLGGETFNGHALRGTTTPELNH